MERRKFIIGAGALLSGSAAAIGTGALSESTMDRTATGEIVGDKYAYLKFRSYGENSKFSSIEDGQLVLDFAKETSSPGPTNGQGLNADSVNYFDGVFRIAAQDNGGAFDVWIESDNPHLSFYWSSKNSGSTTQGNAVRLENAQGADTNVDVGVKIDLEDVDNPQEVLTGNDDFTIHADDTSGGGT
ncbi:DUF1102 domain-containing protein [Halorubellus sp. PRR65]|uniref:DUF1102 domain-containing protein n=1 Tax=Halorubellus sp. PRR65 TaxID=3098148 RepID=UPI002B25FDBA|nr:DUF1102 domain-containing protein [Halorubellus sp. PRR65]